MAKKKSTRRKSAPKKPAKPKQRTEAERIEVATDFATQMFHTVLSALRPMMIEKCDVSAGQAVIAIRNAAGDVFAEYTQAAKSVEAATGSAFVTAP